MVLFNSSYLLKTVEILTPLMSKYLGGIYCRKQLDIITDIYFQYANFNF